VREEKEESTLSCPGNFSTLKDLDWFACHQHAVAGPNRPIIANGRAAIRLRPPVDWRDGEVGHDWAVGCYSLVTAIGFKFAGSTPAGCVFFFGAGGCMFCPRTEGSLGEKPVSGELLTDDFS